MELNHQSLLIFSRLSALGCQGVKNDSFVVAIVYCSDGCSQIHIHTQLLLPVQLRTYDSIWCYTFVWNPQGMCWFHNKMCVCFPQVI